MTELRDDFPAGVLTGTAVSEVFELAKAKQFALPFVIGWVLCVDHAGGDERDPQYAGDVLDRERIGVLRFEPGKVHCSSRTYEVGSYRGSLEIDYDGVDGDCDGVLTADIDSGIDPAVSPPRQLAHFGSFARFGFPPGPAPRDPGDPGRRLDRLDDPIRFNRSDIASFNHLGGSTPGSLYLTDGRYLLSVVRVFGRTGKVKIMRYDQETEKWR